MGALYLQIKYAPTTQIDLFKIWTIYDYTEPRFTIFCGIFVVVVLTFTQAYHFDKKNKSVAFYADSRYTIGDVLDFA